MCVAATVVHYINDTLGVIEDFVDIDGAGAGVDLAFADVDAFYDYAKYWSEAKGFALGLQYNPRSPIYSGDNLNKYKDAMGKLADAPVLPSGNIAQYEADLVAARTLEARRRTPRTIFLLLNKI